MDIKSPLLQKPDYLVCTCMGVMHHDIVRECAQGACSYEAMQEKLLVGTGCSSCVAEVHEIIESYKASCNGSQKKLS